MVNTLINNPFKVSIGIIIAVVLFVVGLLFGFNKFQWSSADVVATYGTVFTITGAAFTVLNTLVVIYLMIWLYHKDSKMGLLPISKEMIKELIELTKMFKKEKEYFINRHERCEDAKEFDPDYVQYSDLYKLEESKLVTINRNMGLLIVAFEDIKNEIKNSDNLTLDDCEVYSDLIQNLIEALSLNSPKYFYELAFLEGNRHDADPEAMINAASSETSKKINALTDLINNSKKK